MCSETLQKIIYVSGHVTAIFIIIRTYLYHYKLRNIILVVEIVQTGQYCRYHGYKFVRES